jgi:hypothetical protein
VDPDADLDFYLMQMWIHADPDPQNWLKAKKRSDLFIIRALLPDPGSHKSPKSFFLTKNRPTLNPRYRCDLKSANRVKMYFTTSSFLYFTFQNLRIFDENALLVENLPHNLLQKCDTDKT